MGTIVKVRRKKAPWTVWGLRLTVWLSWSLSKGAKSAIQAAVGQIGLHWYNWFWPEVMIPLIVLRICDNAQDPRQDWRNFQLMHISATGNPATEAMLWLAGFVSE